MTHIRPPANATVGSRKAKLLSAGGLPLALIVALLIDSVLAPGRGLGAPSLRFQAPLSDMRVNQVATADQHEPTLAVDPTNANIILSAAKDWRTGPKQVWYY